ncbi:DUF123 domain-containing protein [Chloroflexota bacterium]
MPDRPSRANGGTYALILSLDAESTITIGKLGIFTFLPGYYLYTGSALGGLAPRIRRHLEGNGKLHWHIDYLRQEAIPVEVWYLISSEKLECAWYKAAAGMPGARSPVAGFGSSDCCCRSHLVYFTSLPRLAIFRRRLGEQGREVKMFRPESNSPD